MIGLLLDASVKVAMLTLLVWAGTARVGLRGARVAHLAWAAVLAAFVAIPIIAVVQRPVVAVLPSEAGVLSRVPSAVAGFPWLPIYAVIAFILLSRIVLGLWRIRWLRRRSIDVSADPALTSMPAAAAGRRRGVLIRETALLGAPATAGTHSPTVFLPAGWQECDRDDVDAVLWHELAHVERRDFLVLFVARLVAAVCWFHPCAWLAVSRVRWFAELACDAAAAGAVGTERYSDGLLALASGARGALTPPLLSASSGLGARLDLLAADVAPPLRRAVGSALLAAMFLVVVPFVRFGLPAAALQRAGAPHTQDHAAIHAQRHTVHNH
jgi:beta-lactamase regulating signal transducer with metallopeptidase domain